MPNVLDDALARLAGEQMAAVQARMDPGLVHPAWDQYNNMAIPAMPQAYVMVNNWADDFQLLVGDNPRPKRAPPAAPKPAAKFEPLELDAGLRIDTLEGTPPFKMPYDTVEEAQLRLGKTIIRMDGIPVYVEAVHQGVVDELLPPDKRQARKIGFHAYFPTGHRRIVTLDDHEYDFRSIRPGYIQVGQLSAYWMHRVPARCYRQGMNGDNTQFMRPENGQSLRIGHFLMPDLLTGLSSRHKVRPFQKDELDQLLKHVRIGVLGSIRGSDHVAVTSWPEKPEELRVFYNIRCIGTITEGRFKQADELYCSRPWIKEGLMRVGLQ